MSNNLEINFQWYGAQVEKKVLDGAMNGLMKAGHTVAGEAGKLAPELSGTLMRSITASQGGLPSSEPVYQEAKNTTGTKQVVLKEPIQGQELAVYVSANTPYACKQHEEHASQSKFLERGFQAVGQKIPDMVARGIKKVL